MDKSIQKIVKEAKKLGILNETKARNIEIRQKFREMRECNVKYDDAVLKLCDEYFLSISSIQRIISGYKKNKH